MTKMTFRPLNDFILVERQDDGNSPNQDRTERGKVIAVGDGHFDDKGERVPIQVQVGETIVYRRDAGTETEIEKTQHILLQESDVLAVIVKKSNKETRKWSKTRVLFRFLAPSLPIGAIIAAATTFYLSQIALVENQNRDRKVEAYSRYFSAYAEYVSAFDCSAREPNSESAKQAWDDARKTWADAFNQIVFVASDSVLSKVHEWDQAPDQKSLIDGHLTRAMFGAMRKDLGLSKTNDLKRNVIQPRPCPP